MKVKTVLLVEDYTNLQVSISEIVREVFGKNTKVHVVGNLVGAQLFFHRFIKEIDLILMDTNLADGNTFELTKMMRSEFEGSIIATSSDDKDREEMIKCGCTDTCKKGDLLDFLSSFKKKNDA